MKTKTATLTGAQLDWATGVAEGYELSLYGVAPSIRAREPGLGVRAPFKPSKYYNQGSVIIERENLSTARGNDLIFPKGNENGEYAEPLWLAKYSDSVAWTHGKTQLEAGLRCYVASKLGDEIEIPEELC